MNSRATGLSSRFFTVVMLVGPRVVGKSTGKTLNDESLLEKRNTDSGSVVRYCPLASSVSRRLPSDVVTIARGMSTPSTRKASTRAAPIWGGFCAPQGTPAKVVDQLNREINAALADPKIAARLTDLGATPFASSPAEFGKLIAEETEKWGKVVRFAGLRPPDH